MITKKIVRIDASSIKDSSCFRRFYLTTVEGYCNRGINNDIHYGTSFHKCVEEAARNPNNKFIPIKAAMDTWNEKESELIIKDTAKFLDLTHLTFACQRFLDQYDSIYEGLEIITKSDNSLMIEDKFSIPLYEDNNLLILLQGTIDSIVKIRGGCICIGDWKTTRSYNFDEYFSVYKLSPQLKTYLWALLWYKKNYPNSPISNLLEGRGQIGCFIFGAFLSAKEIVKFKRSEIFWYGEDSMLEFEHNLLNLVSKIKDTIRQNILPIAEGSFNGSCVSYTGYKCKFFNACAAQTQLNSTPEIIKHVLSSSFIKREYRPLEFGGGSKQNITTKNEKNTISNSTT